MDTCWGILVRVSCPGAAKTLNCQLNTISGCNYTRISIKRVVPKMEKTIKDENGMMAGGAGFPRCQLGNFREGCEK